VRNNLGLSLALSGAYDDAVAQLSMLTLERGATPRMRQNLALALGLKGDATNAARILRADLGEDAISTNLQYYEAVRGIGAASSTSVVSSTR